MPPPETDLGADVADPFVDETTPDTGDTNGDRALFSTIRGSQGMDGILGTCTSKLASMRDDEGFLVYVTERLATLPRVQAVALGGSRATGTHGSDSDWDFAVYYRGSFEPAHLRDLGWPGEGSEIGDWGGGVFNGGAWLTVDGRRVDVHYRDLDDVDHHLAEAREGRFQI